MAVTDRDVDLAALITAAEETSAITAEAAARAAADTALAGDVTAEAIARAAADTALAGDVTDEATARGSADSALDTRLDSLEDMVSITGSTFTVSIAEVGYFTVNSFGTAIAAGSVGIQNGQAYVVGRGNGYSGITDNADDDSAAWSFARKVQSDNAAASRTTSGLVDTNEGAGAEVIVNLPANAAVGYHRTVCDVGGTGGVAFIAPAGESIRVGLAVTSDVARKVATASGAGSTLTLHKVTATLWMNLEGFVGVWVGS